MKQINYLDSLIKNKTSRIEILKYIELEDNMFDKILDSKLTKIEIIYFSTNPHLSQQNINKLFNLKIDNVNINLLRNSNCPEGEIENFITLNDKIYNIAMAHNPSLQKKHIIKLLEFNDKDVTMSLKFNNYL